MTEEGLFQKKIIKFLNENNCFVTKFNANGLSKVGVPDILACRDGLYLGIEVKKEKGRISDVQQYNINDIRKKGGLAFCVKPSDWNKFKEYFILEQYDKIKELCKHNEKEIKKI